MLITTIVFFSCLQEKNVENVGEATNILAPNVEKASQTAASVSGVNPSRPYYDIVVLDIDRWELCLNYHRIRRDVESYTGHMWYQTGSFIFEGTLTAAYDPIYDQLTAVALDSGWDRGHIVYTMKFVEETGFDMEGIFYYYEYPRRVNRIVGWIEQGRLGEHDAGPWTPMPPASEYPEYHPKKERYDLESQVGNKE